MSCLTPVFWGFLLFDLFSLTPLSYPISRKGCVVFCMRLTHLSQLTIPVIVLYICLFFQMTKTVPSYMSTYTFIFINETTSPLYFLITVLINNEAYIILTDGIFLY